MSARFYPAVIYQGHPRLKHALDQVQCDDLAMQISKGLERSFRRETDLAYARGWEACADGGGLLMSLLWDDIPLQNAGSKGAAKHLACAYFPGTGPTSKTCRSCGFLNIKDRAKDTKGVCSKHAQMQRCKGVKIPASTAACKYFQASQ